MKSVFRTGAVNTMYVLAIAAIAVMGTLGLMLLGLGKPPTSSAGTLTMYCAAGIRPPVAEIARQYEKEYGTRIELQYEGSNTLLEKIGIVKMGDLYLAADESYTTKARDRGLVAETIPIGRMRPVIAVRKDSTKNITAIKDLLRDDVTTAIGNPEQAAVGKKTQKLLTKSGHWNALEEHVTKTGTFLPTVPEVANSVKLGSIDAGIIWDSTVAQYPELKAIRTPELDAGTANITIGVLTSSETPAAALKFARYLTARDRGLKIFESKGFEIKEGDVWAEVPEINFYCGSVNRRAVEPVVDAFKLREGAVVNTSFNGCGILTGQMRTIRDEQQAQGFPDIYMACDVYYLETVSDWFQEGVNISDTEVAIVVPKGNPAKIKSLQDLTKPGVRVTVGQPDQCTIGVLTRQLLTAEGILDEVMKNVVTETATSAMLIPTVTTKSADATFAYLTDTLSAKGKDKIEVIRIESDAAKAIQPLSIARSSKNKNLARRLHQAISQARDKFELAGFHWRLNGDLTTVKPNKKSEPVEK